MRQALFLLLLLLGITCASSVQALSLFEASDDDAMPMLGDDIPGLSDFAPTDLPEIEDEPEKDSQKVDDDLDLGALPDLEELPMLGDTPEHKVKAALSPPIKEDDLPDFDEKPEPKKKKKKEAKAAPPSFAPSKPSDFSSVPSLQKTPPKKKKTVQKKIPPKPAPTFAAVPAVQQRPQQQMQPQPRMQQPTAQQAADQQQAALRAQQEQEKLESALRALQETNEPVDFEYGGSNAAIFDVAGIMLKMKPHQVREIMHKRGFQMLKAEEEIPNFLEWKYDEWCRKRGMVGYDKISNCILAKAEKDEKRYIYKMSFNKYETRESLDVYFTSPYTKNRAFKAEYNSAGDPSLGSSPKSLYQRHDRLRNFWVRVYKKYGQPDDETEDGMIWTKGYEEPLLLARHGYLLLEDPNLPYADQQAMIRVDKKMLNGSLFSF